MNIYINDKQFCFEETELNIEQAINRIDNLPENIVVSLNNTIVQKQKWRETLLKDKDQIIIIRLTCGG